MSANPDNPAPPAWLANFCALHNLRIDVELAQDPLDHYWRIYRSEHKRELGIFVRRLQPEAMRILLEWMESVGYEN